MPRLAPESAEVTAVDAALRDWRQGDLALDEQWFVHVGDPAQALTEAAAAVHDTGIQSIKSEVSGLVVLTQTCDILRACVDRPYIEVAPTILVTDEELVCIQRGFYPALATLPALVAMHLAVDLDRVMTVEKSVVATWTRTAGHASDADARAFAQALARKRARFAFPDDFIEIVTKLRDRLLGKHDKNTDEGRGLRALREIRVQGTPDWAGDVVTLFFWFVRHDADVDFEGKNWADLLGSWLALVRASGRFVDVDGLVCTLDQLTAADYVGSDPLDLDHLSSRRSRPRR